MTISKEIFYATEGVITVKGPSSSDPGVLIGSDFTARVRDFSITGGARDVDSVTCFGSGNNVYFVEKTQEPYECSMTLIKRGIEFNQWKDGADYDTTDPLQSPGSNVTTYWKRDRPTIIAHFREPGNNQSALKVTLGSCYAVSTEMSVSADGYIEETVTFKCLPKHFYVQWTSGGVALPAATFI